MFCKGISVDCLWEQLFANDKEAAKQKNPTNQQEEQQTTTHTQNPQGKNANKTKDSVLKDCRAKGT